MFIFSQAIIKSRLQVTASAIGAVLAFLISFREISLEKFTFQITNSITVWIIKGLRVDLIENAVLPPLFLWRVVWHTCNHWQRCQQYCQIPTHFPKVVTPESPGNYSVTQLQLAYYQSTLLWRNCRRRFRQRPVLYEVNAFQAHF